MVENQILCLYLIFLQLFVFARDQRLVNEKTGTATVNVFIDFDDAPRYLDNLPYPANIQESQSINSPVAQMRGTDPDLKVKTWGCELNKY